MAAIKYVQIGVGHAHASKISVYRKSKDFEVVGVAEPDAALRKRAQAQAAYNDLKWLSVDEALHVKGLQVVGVETEVQHLLDTAEKCIDAGFHIHLDKPAGESLPQFKRILDKAASRHLLVQMGYMYRYSPAVVMLREFLKQGWLGEPFELHAVMSKLVAAASRRRLAEYRGGTMFELGCHLIDLVHGVLGTPQKVHAFPRHSSMQKDDLLDNMLAVFEYPTATATVRSSVNEVDGFRRRHLAVCGSEGTFHIQPLDAPNATFALSRPRGKYRKGYQDVKFGGYSRYVADSADMAKIVRGEKEPDFSYDHDYQVQKSILLAGGVPTDR